MAKNMSVPELIRFSRYEGHPVLWHMMLIPLVKLGLPVFSMNVLSFLIVSASAFLFLFKGKNNLVIKCIVLFTVPFVYIFSSISRNYCLILPAVVLIGILYEKRREKPFLYSLPIVLLVFSHALSWGMVAGLTVTFYVVEIVRFIAKKSELSKKKFIGLLAGFLLIAASSLFVVLTMSGERNSGYSVYPNAEAEYTLFLLSGLILLVFADGMLFRKKYIKEALIIGGTFLFQIIVYTQVYSSVGLQRFSLIPAFLLFYLMVAGKEEEKRNAYIPALLLLLPLLFFGKDYLKTVVKDVRGNYSSAQEMAWYINANLGGEDIILVDAGIFEQTIVPYVEPKLYDIVYEADIEDSLYHVLEINASLDALKDIPNHEEYRGKYLIVYAGFEIEELKNGDFEEVFRTGKSLKGEDYILYYVKK